MKRLILILMVLIGSTLLAQEPTKVRIKDKQTEVSPSGGNYVILDRDDYENYKKLTLASLRNYINIGLNVHNLTGINITGWQPGQILKFASNGVLVPAEMPTGGTGGGTSNVQYLNDLQDVSTLGGTTGQVLTLDAGIYKPKPLPSYTDTKVQAGEGIEVSQSSPTMQQVAFKSANLQTETATPAANLYFVVDASGNSRKMPFANVQGMLSNTQQVYLQINREQSIFIDNADLPSLQYKGVAVWTVDAQGDDIEEVMQASDLQLEATGCSATVFDIDVHEATLNITGITDNASVKITHLPSGAYKTWTAVVWAGPSTGGGIGDNSIKLTTKSIADNAISSAKLQAGAVTSSRIANIAVQDAHIAAGAVSSTKIASGAVIGSKIATYAVSNSKIQAAAVTAEKIEDNAVTNAKIANNAISTNKIATAAITAKKIQQNAIDKSRLTTEVQQGLFNIVTQWPTYSTTKIPINGLYYNTTEGKMRFYHAPTDGSCQWSYDEFISNGFVCPENKANTSTTK